MSACPNSDRQADILAGSCRAMCGRLRVGKENLTSRRWSVRPCVRPVSAVRMTAGHNAFRGSGPGQKPAFDNAVARVGCPDRRIDRLCITCCSPSQPSHHATQWRDLVHAASAAGSKATAATSIFRITLNIALGAGAMHQSVANHPARSSSTRSTNARPRRGCSGPA
jgi:hypothetical protein